MGAEIPTIRFEDFSRLDLRVATVKAAEVHPNADRLLRITLDDGTASGRQVLAGIRGYYDPAQLVGKLVGKHVVIVANLEPRKIRGELSEGMILAAVVAGSAAGGESDVVLVTLDRPVPAGSAVS